ncbi:MAG: hypothetical protein AAGA48_27050 [Myxococcota bacterium]
MSRAGLVAVLLMGCAKTVAPEAAPVDAVDESKVAASGEPREILEAFADHERPGLRARAVEWLVRAGAEGRPDDPSAWVQRAEVVALGRRADAAATARRQAMAARDDIDPWVRCLAALLAPDPSFAVALSDYATEPQPWRRLPLALGAWASGDAQAREVVEAALRSGLLDWNLELMLALGDRGDAALAVALAEAQRQAEPELQLAIAAARLLAGDDEAAQAFEVVLRNGEIEARLEAIDLLQHVPTEPASRLLDAAAAKGPEIVTSYVEIIGVDRGDTRAARLRKAMASDDPELRTLVVRHVVPGAMALPWRPQPLVDDKRGALATPIVTEALTDADPGVRRQAVESAAALGLDVTPVVQALLLDDDPTVRIAAAGYLLVQGSR